VVDDRRDQRTCPAHPIGKDRAIDRHAVSGHDDRLTIKRHVFGMLRHGNLRQQGFGRPATFQQMCGSLGLNDARAALGASVFRADRHDHLVARRNLIQPLRLVFTDFDHVAATTRASNAIGFDHPLDTRQVLRQRPCFAFFARSRLLWIGSLFRINLAGRYLVFDEGDLRLCFGNGRLEVFQRQFHLRRIELFRFRPKLCVAVVLN
jgi:hypothetical protein